MGYPRRLIVPPGSHGTYHCVSRCVRRAFLCGKDELTGRSFEHRKQWLEKRILELGSLFAVAVHAYAVMSNHVHVVLEVDPDAARAWPDEDVARRWLELAGRRNGDSDIVARTRSLMAQPERLSLLRERLGSLSWFMRFLKEPIARRANREDGCTGRFWEGRFKTQVLLDDAAVLACMVYVDLNPVRAGHAKSAGSARHTSFRRRQATETDRRQDLGPVAASIHAALPALSQSDYRDLVHWTESAVSPLAPAGGAAPKPAALQRLGVTPGRWIVQVPATESRYWRAVGQFDALIEFARVTGRRWVRGIGLARSLEQLPDTS